MPTAKVGDINIYYEIHGEGEPLVLIMGWGGNIGWWLHQIPSLSQECRVVAFDNRGTGRSDKPDIDYTMDMMADDVVGLLDVIGIDAAHVCGVSLGGSIAQNLALRYPERVISLILACSGCGGPHRVLPDAEVIAWLSDFERLQKLTPEENLRENMPFMCSQQFIDNNPDIVEQIIAKSTEYPTPIHGGARQAQAGATHDTYDLLPEIKVPTLVMHGEADRMSLVESGRLLVSRIPNAELVIFKDMGHGFFWEAADEFNRTVLDFLRRHSGTRIAG